jgi:hypothetical protein
MKCCPLVVQLAALTLFIAPFANAQEDTPVSGKVTTTQKIALKTAPKASSAAVTMLAPNTDLRWVMGDHKGKYLRIMFRRDQAGGFWNRKLGRLPNRIFPRSCSRVQLSLV